MTTIFKGEDGNMYSLERGWESEEDYWVVEYGFAPEPLPGLSVIRSIQHQNPKRLPGNIFNTLLTVAGASVITQMLSQQYARTTGSLVFEALFARTPAQVVANVGIVSAPVVALVVVTNAYISALKRYEPQTPNERSSFWKSVGASMAGTFGGMPDVGSY